jgi:hypothetical protein
LAREAFDATEAAMAATIEAGVGKAALLKAIDWCYATQSGGVGTRLEWLKTPPKRHSPSTMSETLEKIRALKALGVHVWPLDGVALSKQQAYAAHVQMRRPSMTARIERQRQTVEITCFLHVTLLELTDMALLQASRRSQDLVRRAAERVEKGRSRSSGTILQQALKAKSVLHDESKPWRDRVLEARALLHDIGEAGTSTFASQVRRALAEDNRRVHAHLAGLRDIEFAGASGDPGHDQWQAWQRLQALGTKEIPQDFELPPVGAAWNTIVSDLDPQSRYRAFEASTMMALRKSLRRGSAWVNHSISFRARESMLLAGADWSRTKELHHQILGLPDQAMAFLEPILAGVSVGLTALAEAAGRGQIEIGADELLHLPPIRPMDEEVEPRKTREGCLQAHRLRPVARPAAGSRRRHPLQRGAAGPPSVVEQRAAGHLRRAPGPWHRSRRQGRGLDDPRHRRGAHLHGDAGRRAERQAAPGQRTGVGVPERAADRGALGRRHQGLCRHDGHGRQPPLVDGPGGPAPAHLCRGAVHPRSRPLGLVLRPTRRAQRAAGRSGRRRRRAAQPCRRPDPNLSTGR